MADEKQFLIIYCFLVRHILSDIEENEYAATDVRLYPNPVEDRLSLQLPDNIHCEKVKIYGIDSRLLKAQDDDFESIDLSRLAQGVYIVKINLNEGQIYTEKIVVK